MLSEEFIRKQAGAFGAEGEAFVRRLPALLAEYAHRWDLELLPPFALSYHYVVPALRGGREPVVVKAGVPGSEDLGAGTAALRLFDGQGMVRLLEDASDEGIVLLERVLPGRELVDFVLPGPGEDEVATRIAAGVFGRIWRPIPAQDAHHFPTVADMGDAFGELRAAYQGSSGPFPMALFDRAERLYRELAASQGEIVLLHGDLHHWNILSAEREPWLAIDPKGVAGEREFEAGALLKNPCDRVASWPDLPRLQARRLDILAEMLNLNRQRMAAWAFAFAVLSSVWVWEETGAPDADMLVVAEALLPQLGS
jgi:streptomycin 6-kinase